MAKGSIAKEELTEALLNRFDGAFLYGKEIRIPWKENGEMLQIKVTLTCAKVAVEPEDGTTPVVKATQDSAFPKPIQKEYHVTEEEKQNIENLISALGL